MNRSHFYQSLGHVIAHFVTPITLACRLGRVNGLAVLPKAAILVSVSLLGFTDTGAAQDLPEQKKLDPEEVRFVGDVVCRNEYSNEGRWRCNRWVQSPTMSTFSDGSHHPTMVRNVVKELNSCLPEATQIKLLEPNDSTATLKVFFQPVDDFHTVAEKYKFPYVPDNWGFFDTRWNKDYEIERAIVLIGHDRLSGKRLHHFLLEEITQSLGLAGDSKRFKSSVFYEDEPRNRFGSATKLTPLDKKTIRFFYNHVQPGFQPIEVGVQMAIHWHEFD